jgi:hypothetical protein
MTEQEQIQALKNQLAALQQNLNSGSNPALSGWSKPQSTGTVNIQGVAIPVSVQTPIGKVRCYFWLGSEAATPDGLQAALEQMHAAGLPIDAWEDKKSSWSGNDNSRGGYSRSNNWKR